MARTGTQKTQESGGGTVTGYERELWETADTLRDIARNLVETVRGNVTIDWALRENVRANLRGLVRHILEKYGYPPGNQEKATRAVIEQAEALSSELAGADYCAGRVPEMKR